jgi:hypothetical protein
LADALAPRFSVYFSTKEITNMRKVVLTFGVISGLILAVLVWINTGWLCDGDLISLDYAMFIGYASMLIALTMVFFGIKSYRDNYAGGKVTFWKAVQIGLLISLIASVFYYLGATSYSVTHPGFDERFIAKWTEHEIGKIQASGGSQAEIDEAKQNVELMRTLFQNPLLFFVICLLELLPVGIIVTLVSAALLRRSDVLPAPST